MTYRLALAVIALALGLAGCVSYPSAYRSDIIYEDGSYYSPAGGDQGDYYFAPEDRYDSPYDPYYYDDFFYDPYFHRSGFYGSPFYTGYCSTRYRYCPSYGYTPFLSSFPRYGFTLSFGNFGWYDPFRYSWQDPYWSRYRHSRPVRRPPPPRLETPGPALDIAPAPTRQFQRPRQRPIASEPFRTQDDDRAPAGYRPAPVITDGRGDARSELREARLREALQQREWRQRQDPAPMAPIGAPRTSGPARSAYPAPRNYPSNPPPRAVLAQPPRPPAPPAQRRSQDSDDSDAERRERRGKRSDDRRGL